MMNKYRMMLFQFSDGKGGNNLEKKNSQPVRKFVLCISKKKRNQPMMKEKLYKPTRKYVVFGIA